MWREGDGQGGRRDRSRDEYSGYSGARGPRAARDPCSGCVARERARRSRPLSSRVSTAVREVVFPVSRGTLGLTVGGPIDRISTGCVLQAMLWRQGASIKFQAATHATLIACLTKQECTFDVAFALRISFLCHLAKRSATRLRKTNIECSVDTFSPSFPLHAARSGDAAQSPTTVQ